MTLLVHLTMQIRLEFVKFPTLLRKKKFSEV